MNANMKLGIGAALAAVGALGIVIGPAFGFADLGRPWSFLLGFVVGIIAGMGAALSVSGLIDVRRNR
jgi:hypothetical protein